MRIKLPNEGELDLPIESMVVKDSIFIPTLNPTEAGNVVREAGKSLGYTITVRKTVNEGYYGIMFWRVA